MEQSRSIPAEVKRRVRQECHFGCVICGMPVFEYEHIDDWADVQTHEVKNLALLCPNHHAAKTTKKLSRERIRAARKEPFNKTRKLSARYKVEGDANVNVQIAGQHFFGAVPDNGEPCEILTSSDKTLMGVRTVDGWMALSFNVTDRSGRILLQVVDGELTVATDVWDFRYEGSKISVRSASHKIVLELELSSSKLKVVRGVFLDENLDGFIVEDGNIEFRLNEASAMVLGGEGGSIGSGKGALLVVNRKLFPNFQPSGGYAIVCDPGPQGQ